MSEVKSKETVVVEMVNAEKYTREEILAASGATPGSLASYLTAMRNAAKFTGAACCPIEVEEDGKKIFKVTTWDEAEAAKAARVPKTKKSSRKPSRSALMPRRSVSPRALSSWTRPRLLSRKPRPVPASCG